jgi:N-acetylglucosaminyldiphosphoundecaprenol N-acetyl-beta-D-mannosaminyltransferase
MSALPNVHPLPVRRSSTIRARVASRVSIGHALVDNCSFEEAQTAILAHAAADGEPACVVTSNAQHVVLLDHDLRFREIYRKADLVVADGASLLFAARVFGRALKERVAGVDLFESLCARTAPAKLRVFFLGGRPGSADSAATQLRKRYPGFNVQTHCPSFGFEKNPAELDRIESVIRTFRPHIVFVGFGAPKQEYWIHEHGRKIGANVYIGIGGSFELVGGVVKRAPQWIQGLGFEWLYRLCREPRRLWRRYLIGNWQFLRIILRQKRQGHR